MDTLGAFLIHRFARDRDGRVELAGATDDMRSLIAQVGECDQPAKIRPDTRPPLARILTDMGRATMEALKMLVAFVEFFGQMMVAMWELVRSEEHTSELQSLMRISYAVFCLQKKHNT